MPMSHPMVWASSAVAVLGILSLIDERHPFALLTFICGSISGFFPLSVNYLWKPIDEGWVFYTAWIISITALVTVLYRISARLPEIAKSVKTSLRLLARS